MLCDPTFEVFKMEGVLQAKEEHRDGGYQDKNKDVTHQRMSPGTLFRQESISGQVLMIKIILRKPDLEQLSKLPVEFGAVYIAT